MTRPAEGLDATCLGKTRRVTWKWGVPSFRGARLSSVPPARDVATCLPPAKGPDSQDPRASGQPWGRRARPPVTSAASTKSRHAETRPQQAHAGGAVIPVSRVWTPVLHGQPGVPAAEVAWEARWRWPEAGAGEGLGLTEVRGRAPSRAPGLQIPGS